MLRTSIVCLAVFVVVAPGVRAADIEAGRAKVQSVCAACHGANGVSVSDAIPNLAAQKSAYIESQLKALKDGARKNAIMNPIAGQLSVDDIANVAAFFAAQPGAATGAKSALLANVAKTSVVFPDDYKSTFTRYHTINFPAQRQVRYYYANRVALQAAKDGKPLPDGSVLLAEHYSAKLDAEGKPIAGEGGFFVADKLVNYAVMASNAGWGKDIPDMLRNGDWNYGVFVPDKQPRAGVNQAECLACHKPLDKTSYTFTLDQLTAAAKAK